MKTHRVVGARPVREAERKGRKEAPAPGAPEFAQVLLALPHLTVARPAPQPTVVHPSNAAKPAPTAAVQKRPGAEERRAMSQVPSPTAAPLAPQLAPAPNAPRELEAPPMAFAAHLEEDPAMRVTVSANTAAMKLQTADGSDVSLYLRIRDGSAQLRIEGAVQQVEQRSDELRVALAHEGITLQRLDVQTVTAPKESSGASLSTDTTDRDHAPPDRPELPEPAVPARAPTTSASPTHRVERGLHVRA